MQNDLSSLKFDPLPALLSAQDPALTYFVHRDLLSEPVPPVDSLWSLPGARRILRKQLPDGSWPKPGPNPHPAIKPGLVETFRQLRFLVDQYGLDCRHPQVSRAAEFIFSCQSPEGDLRGILANQYATYYTGAILAVLIRAGYADDPRLERGLQWLLSMRQDDLGWSIPLITHKLDRRAQYRLTTQDLPPLQPDRSKPFSHHWTGMVLRAFAAHPQYHHSEPAFVAARLLKSRFFQPDAYTSYQDPGYWLRFEYPFWWNHLLSAMDTLSLMAFPPEDPDIQPALAWFVDHQEPSGLWKADNRSGIPNKDTPKTYAMKLWVTLAICRVFKRLYRSSTDFTQVDHKNENGKPNPLPTSPTPRSASQKSKSMILGEEKTVLCSRFSALRSYL